MARGDRLFRLLDLMRRLPPPVTAARLAAETGVSLRTLYRDVEALRAAGALIDGEAGFGYRLTEDPALPPQSFARLEIEALTLGLAEVRAIGDPALADAAASAQAKLVATLPERQQRQALHAALMAYRYGPQPPLAVDPAILREACWAETAVDVAYVDLSGARTERRIWPLAVVFLERSLEALAWCRLREDFRRFRLDRMTALTPTDESLRPRRVPLLRQYVARLAGRDR
jgi:predicted DNA-binding transcriptional regulator YafY